MRVNEWQPIETAPKDTTVLIHWAESKGYNGHTGIGGLADCEEDGFLWYEDHGADSGETCLEDPTHWMPLPEPPAGPLILATQPHWL